MLTRRKILGTGATSRVGSRAVYAWDRKPGLSYILADDHAVYVPGAGGNRRASTPNLDLLAGEGTPFARNDCKSPVCTPLRQSIPAIS
jgi:arylsulfatase A-like enzyme